MKGHRPFIVIESLDAAGGSTQTKLLTAKLKRNGFRPYQLHFPQEDRATGQLIYQKFLYTNNRTPASQAKKKKAGFSRREQSLLYIQDFFARYEDMWQIIHSGTSQDVLVTDRFCTSTMAYQSAGLTGKQRQHLLDWMTWLCWQGKLQLPKPDAIILLDIDTGVALKHLKKKRRDYHENRKKLTVVRRSYMRLAKEQSWYVINSMDKNGTQRPKQAIHQDIWQAVEPLLQ